jgi:hypothetical protein
MQTWLRNVCLAVWAWLGQLGIALDDLANVLFLGPIAIVHTAVTNVLQDTVYADETLSAHAYRADERGRLFGRVMRPAIDWAWQLQKPDPVVDAAVSAHEGRPRAVTSHCERAFWKKKLHLYSPTEYRTTNPT